MRCSLIRSTVLMLGLSLALVACGDKPSPPAPKAAKTAVVKAPAPADGNASIGVNSDGEQLVDPTRGPPVNDEDAVGRKIMAKYPDLRLQSVHKLETTGPGLYEFVTDTVVGYTNEAVDFIMVGELIVGEGAAVRNLTKERKDGRAAALVGRLPVDQALVYRYGAGQRTVTVFSDPDCPFCQQFETQLKEAGDATNITLRVLPMPLTELHPDANRKAKYLMCTQDPAAAWHEWMTSGIGTARPDWTVFAAKHPSTPDCERAKAVDATVAIAAQLGISQTPTILFENGMVFNGLPTLEELENSLAVIAQAKQQAAALPATSTATPAVVPSAPAPSVPPAR